MDPQWVPWISKTWWGTKSPTTCPLHPPFSRFCTDSVQWKLIDILWLRLWSMGNSCTHERGEKYWVVCNSCFIYWKLFIYSVNISVGISWVLYVFFLKSPTAHAGNGPLNQPENPCVMPCWEFPTLDEATAGMLPSDHIGPRRRP